VEYHRANRVYEDVLSNVCDVGLVAFAVKESRLEVIPLWRDKLVLVCPPRHPLAARESVSLAALRGERFISFEPDIPTRRAIDKAFRSEGVEVQHVMEVDNIETVKRAVEIELGVSIIPQSTVTQEVRAGTLSQIELTGGDFARPVSAIIKKSKVLSPAMKQFLGILKEPKPAADGTVEGAEPVAPPPPRAPPASRHAGSRRPAAPAVGIEAPPPPLRRQGMETTSLSDARLAASGFGPSLTPCRAIGKAKATGDVAGVGLDSDGHKRLTTGPNFALVGGTASTHDVMVEKAVKINEHLKRRGKELGDVSREEFDDIAHEVGLRRPTPEKN
jgi:hypothetical protein